MTTTAKTTRFFPFGSELAVILLTLLALLAGWLLMSSVVDRSVAFSGSGITAQLPAGWLTLNPGGSELVHVSDRTPSGFPTTYLIEARPVAADATGAQVASLVTLERGTSLMGYRVLSQQDVLVQGRPATEIDYVYVELSANLTHAVIPSVVRAKDYIIISGSQAVIVGYRADQSNYAADLGRFYRFLVSVK